MARKKSQQFDSEQSLTWFFLGMGVVSLISGLVGSALHMTTP